MTKTQCRARDVLPGMELFHMDHYIPVTKLAYWGGYATITLADGTKVTHPGKSFVTVRYDENNC